MDRRSHRFVALCLPMMLALGVSSVGHAHHGHTHIYDGFEGSVIGQDFWHFSQARPDAVWVATDVVRNGHGALAIRIGPEDTHPATMMQRNEVRVAKAYQLPFGADVWYGFSFRIEGEIERRASTRWIIGQWKEDSDASPFLAQRFDNGVFHITVQDDICRVLVAAANGPEGGLTTDIAHHELGGFDFVSDFWTQDCTPELTIARGDNPTLPDPYGNWVDMVYHIKGDRDGHGLIEIWANGRFIARVTGSIGSDRTNGPMQYFKIGMYRDIMPGSATIYVDDFRRGATRSDIDPVHEVP